MTIPSAEAFGALPSGEKVEMYVLGNAAGIQLSCLNYGAIIQSLIVPDAQGIGVDVTPGYDDIDGYLRDPNFFGGLIGRYANRIANGRFTLDAVEYSVDANDGPNHLHGGRDGFHRVVWDVEPFSDDDAVGLVLRYVSPAGDQGYPGALALRVTYTLNDRNELSLDYFATTDAPTPVNLTQHAYFNLAGHDAGSAMQHAMQINASRYTPVTEQLIPMGEHASVEGTPFDFRHTHPILETICVEDEQLQRGAGYDHNYVLDGPIAAMLHDPWSGRTLEITTTEPGIQFYSGNHLGMGPAGKGGHVYRRRSSIALETQHFPDSPNQPGFPSTILRPGEEFRSRTVYRFGVS